MTALAPPPQKEKPMSDEKQTLVDLQRTVSASRLSLFLQCRLRFFFRYVLRLKKPKSPSLQVGNSVHAVLKAWNKARWRGKPLTLKELHDSYSQAWTDQLKEEPVDWKDDDPEAEKACGWRIVETYLRETNLPPDVRPDAVEVSVEADLRKHGLPTLIGVLDLVQQRKIIDYKTSGTTPNPEKVTHSHEVQTSGYAVLYRESTGHTEKGIELHHLVKLKNPKVVITTIPPMSPRQEKRLFSLMDSYQEGIAAEGFYPSPGMQCAGCEFFNECRNWA